MNFNSILIGSDNPQRLVEYYTALFGPPQTSDEGYTSWMLGGGMVSIGAHSEVHGTSAHPGRLIWNIETKDVREVFDRFVAAGAIVVRQPYNFEDYPDMWIATLADPDDNYFQLVTPMGAPDSTS